MRDLLLVGGGGFLGSVSRWLVAGWVHRALGVSAFPVGTLVVNVAGCLVIGLAAGLAEGRGVLGPEARLFLLLGFLGGFTTFSTFGYETVGLARGGEDLHALANVGLHLGLGLAAVWLGGALARWMG
jgi:CrcB protein